MSKNTAQTQKLTSNEWEQIFMETYLNLQKDFDFFFLRQVVYYLGRI